MKSGELIICLINSNSSAHILESRFCANCERFLKKFRHGMLLSREKISEMIKLEYIMPIHKIQVFINKFS